LAERHRLQHNSRVLFKKKKREERKVIGTAKERGVSSGQVAQKPQFLFKGKF
jgi:hypothetical protein